MQAIILAAGKGTRLLPFTETAPKSMVPILGKSLIDYKLQQLKEAGINDVVIYEAHQAEVLRQHLGDGSTFGLNISHREVTPEIDSSTGCVRDALSKLDDENTLLFIYGDNFSNIDIPELVRHHDPSHTDLTTVVKRKWLSDERGVWKNCGTFVISRSLLDKLPHSGNFSFDIETIGSQLSLDRFVHDGYSWNVNDAETVREIESTLRHSAETEQRLA